MDIFDIKNKVKELPERDVRGILQLILMKINLFEDNEISLDELSNDLKKIYNHILYLENSRNSIEIAFEKGNFNKAHILFGYPYLAPVLKDLNLQEEEIIIPFNDNFAVGPIFKLNEESGQKERFNWLRNNLRINENYIEQLQKTINYIVSIPEDIPINIWVSENAHEQTGLLFVNFILRGRKNKISLINTSKEYNVLFKEKAKKYIPFSSRMVIPEELKDIYIAAKEKQKYLTDSEKALLETQWESHSAVNCSLRLWEKANIQNVSEDYYDNFIIKRAKKIIGMKNEYIPAVRLIGEVYGRIFQYIEDRFLEFRLRKLIEKGIFEYVGTLEAMRSYRIKFKNED